MVAAYGPLARALCLALLTIGLIKGQAEPPAAEPALPEPVTRGFGDSPRPTQGPVATFDLLAETPESEDVDDAGVDVAGARLLTGDVPPHHEPPRLEPIRRVCRVTAYCDWGLTASGRRVGVGQCAAPAFIPFGSRVYIPALGRSFVVTDRTHPRFRRNTVDIFIPSEGRCRDFGRRYLKCEFTVAARDKQG
jgi:3D (Asp-Asp-Asp) domain-containing protein